MDVYVPLIITFVATLCMALLQLDSSCLMLLRREAAKKLSAGRAGILSGFFIFGLALVFISFIFLAYLCIEIATPFLPDTRLLYIGLASVLVAVSIIIALCYYRRGAGTRLWLPRKSAHYLNDCARSLKTPLGAVFYGFESGFYELPFMIVPMLIIALELNALTVTSDICFLVGVATLIFIVPVIRLALKFRTANWSEIQRRREKNKTLTLISLIIFNLILATAVVTLKIMGVLNA